MPEDYPEDEVVHVIHANDDDRGDNAELSYILDTTTQLKHGQVFRLHRSTGEVRFNQCCASYF